MASHDGLPVSSRHDTFGRRALELGVAAHVAISHIWHEPDLRRCPHPHFSLAARPESVAAVADLMFPGDGLPGASELELHNRIVAMPELQALMTRGVVWLDNRAKNYLRSG